MRSSGPVLRLVSSRLAVGAGAGTKRKLVNGAERTLKRSTMGEWAARAVAGAAVVLMAGCSLSVDANRKQCKVDGDCTDRGPDFEGSVCRDSVCSPPPPPPDWTCLSNPPPSPAPAGTFKVRTRVTNIVGSGPLMGVTVKVCAGITDPQCETPQHPPVVSGENGNVELTVNANFAGFAELTFPNFATTLFFFNPPVRADMEIASMQMVENRFLPILTGLVDAPPKEGHGIVLLNVLNCLGVGAAGVTFSTTAASEDTVTFYARGSAPVKELTETEASGYGGFVNVPVSETGASSVPVTATLSTGQVVAKTAVLVRPGTLTIGRMVHDG